MEIQSDLIILPPNNNLPLPWSVRGPLGLQTGAEVSIALVQSNMGGEGLPDIVVTPLQSEYLNSTFTLDVELGERTGAVADFLSWLGDGIAEKCSDNMNIVLSETITLEGRNKHKMHIVLEPAADNCEVTAAEIEEIMKDIRASQKDVQHHRVNPVYKLDNLTFMLQQTVPVKHGWIHYGDWKKRILEKFPRADEVYDLSRVVVSSNPDQRLLRYIIPKRGVIELQVPHRNKPGALKELSRVIGGQGYNILSSRLSRTPPPDRTAKTSVFVAACEPLKTSGRIAEADLNELRAKLRALGSYSIDTISINEGKPGERSLFLTPKRKEIVQIDTEIAVEREMIRADIGTKFLTKHGYLPKKFVFLSKRFIENVGKSRPFYEEQRQSVREIVRGLEAGKCAVIEAANPGDDENRYYDLQVYRAVFSRLWASDACAVLALNEDGAGQLSLSIAHEIGFFSGRNKPLKVFTALKRDKDPVFGNIVGMNRVTYADDDGAFVPDNPASLFVVTKRWAESIVQKE